MKNSPLVTALTVMVGVLTAVILFLAVVFEVRVRQLRKLQPQVNYVQNSQSVINALANDAVDYSKHNPAIDAILQPLGMKPGKGVPGATAKPAGK